MVLLNADHDLQRFVIYNVHVFVAHKYVDVVYHEMLQIVCPMQYIAWDRI